MKKTLLSLFAVLGVTVIVDSLTNEAHTWQSQAPAGYTGSPADGQTCAQGCHNTSDSPTAMFTSDIPTDGYIPGETYTIGFGGTTGSHTEYGFQASPQTSNGSLVGSLTAGSGTTIVNNKYVTHSGAFNGAIASWSFQWTAPSAGTGEVTFYGAMIASNNNNNDNGDTGLKGTYTIGEAGVGVLEEENLVSKVFPTFFDHSITVKDLEGETYSIVDLNGKKVKEGILNSNNENLIMNELNTGLYLLNIKGSVVKLMKK